MVKYHQIIVTSEIDNNYFIITNGIFYINELIQLFKKKNIDVTNIFTPVINNPELINKKIFIDKNSYLGINLEKLINEQQLIDENNMIRDSYLYNALISSNVNEQNTEYIKYITNLIKENKSGPIKSLSNSLDINSAIILKLISYEGRKNCYVKEEIITGFETEGITYQDNIWLPININSKKIEKIRILR